MAKKLSITMVITILATILLIPTANANLQSRPNTDSASYSPSDWFLLSRQVETSSGPMGLNATIEIEGTGANAKVVETSASNNIDVHMIKNTEYGTAAILSASSYGSCPEGYNSRSIKVDSTTGNDSGIMQMALGKNESVVGISTTTSNGDNYIKYLRNSDSWYKNVYDNSNNGIPGDATTETPRWRGARSSNLGLEGDIVYIRSFQGVFSCYGSTLNTWYGSRFAVVCGVGL